MSEIKTTGDYFTSTVDEKHLEEVQKDLLSNSELIGYSHNKENGTIDIIVNLENMGEHLRYIQ